MPNATHKRKKDALVLWYDELTNKDVAYVGGKNASLGEMYAQLAKSGVRVPNGFALTAKAYNLFLDHAGIRDDITKILKGLDTHNLKNLTSRGRKIRETILRAEFPDELNDAIEAAYLKLSKTYGEQNTDIAARSSATAEDLPGASFAGQQETYLNVRGVHEVLEATKKCMASLFTNRAISYREDKGFDHMSISLSVGIQKMVRSDSASSGVMFSIDPESGFRNAVVINATWGLGEMIVQGKIDPDEYVVFKPTLMQGAKTQKGKTTYAFRPIVDRKIGSKKSKMVYSAEGDFSVSGSVKEVQASEAEQKAFVLTDDEVLDLAYWATLIEQHYKTPMDIEWAKDGKDGKLYIVQARPETVRAMENKNVLEEYLLDKKAKVLVEGVAVGAMIGAGKVHVIKSAEEIQKFKEGEILVTEITDPDWEPIMKIASGIVTNSGGRTSHAAIVSRELGIPAIVGAEDATTTLKTGKDVTVSCAEGERGFVYRGRLPFHVRKTDISKITPSRTKIMQIVADTDRVFDYAQIPNQGVGLAREELIIASHISVHPLALLHFNELKDKDAKEAIAELTKGYRHKGDYFVDKLAEGIGKITAAFYPNEVIVRMSDFKSNEYANLMGGQQFEPHEENPMLGWRGASRYYSEEYKDAFVLECRAFKKVREEMGLKNMKVMIPFCRTPEEGKKVLSIMEENGLKRGVDGLEVYVMCEIPSNVLLADQFAKLFDGFSIGTNDLTQLTLGLDRDSALVAHIYDERNEAVTKLLAEVIKVAHKNKRKVGICGQAPSDFPEIAEFLVDHGIDSISLTPDAVIKTTLNIGIHERKKKARQRRKRNGKK
ncbi:MAG: phosphoenolpyruvate synthase [Candidatus Kerfeldbacteria bacterium]